MTQEQLSNNKSTPEKKELDPLLRAVQMSLFPSMDSLEEVISLAESKLPITDKNELVSILMMYHNTLLNQLNNERNKHV